MLILPIKYQWFHMIISGVKKAEYRDIKPYYTSRFRNIGLLDEDGCPTNKEVWIKLRNGYGKNKPSVNVLVSLRIGFGNPMWGGSNITRFYILEIKALQTEL